MNFISARARGSVGERLAKGTHSRIGRVEHGERGKEKPWLELLAACRCRTRSALAFISHLKSIHGVTQNFLERNGHSWPSQSDGSTFIQCASQRDRRQGDVRHRLDPVRRVADDDASFPGWRRRKYAEWKPRREFLACNCNRLARRYCRRRRDGRGGHRDQLQRRLTTCAIA